MKNQILTFRKLALVLFLLAFARPGQAAFIIATNTPGGTVSTVPLSNSWVQVSASPAPGWRFLYWQGDASGTNPIISINLTRNKFVEAIFGTRLTLSSVVTADPQLDFYPFGSVVKLSSVPPSGTYFVQWSGDATGSISPLAFVVTNANPSISCLLAALSAGQAALTIIEVGAGHVTVSPTANPYAIGQPVTLSAKPNPGQSFVGWSGDTNSSANPIQLILTQSRVLTATFTKRPMLSVNTPLDGLTEDGFRFTLTGAAGATYKVFSSSDLASWVALGTAANTYGSVQFTDPGASNSPQSFYRSQVLPGYSLTLKNLGDSSSVVAAGTPAMLEPSNLGQTTAAFTVPSTNVSLLTLLNINDTSSNTVPSGTSLIPVNIIGTTASIFTAMPGQSAIIPLMATLPAPFNTRPPFHAFIGGYGFTVQPTATTQNVPALADGWPVFKVWFNSPQYLVLDLNPPATLGHTAAAFQAPATNKTVQVSVPDWIGTTNSVMLIGGKTYAVAGAAMQSVPVSLSIPFGGVAGTDILIGGSPFHVDRTSVTNSTLINVFATPAGFPYGTVMPPGIPVTLTNLVPSSSLGNTLAQFTVPANGAVSISMDQPYLGQTNQVIWLNQNPYLVLSAGNH